MNENEKLGWLGMFGGLGLAILSFIPYSVGYGFDPRMLIVTIIGLCIFMLGLVKALPEVIEYLFIKNKNESEVIEK